MPKDLYKELDKAISEWENGASYKSHDTFWIVTKIAWCNQYKKLPKQQIDSLCDRTIKILDKEKYYHV